MTIKSLDDVVSKLSSDCDDSAAALRNAVQTLQRGVQAEIRNLCKPWGVQLTAKNDNGKYSKRGNDVLKAMLTATFIEKAEEHLRAKAPMQMLQSPAEHCMSASSSDLITPGDGLSTTISGHSAPASSSQSHNVPDYPNLFSSPAQLYPMHCYGHTRTPHSRK